jgi:pyruvate dehydrogenase E2 component (dihydrolipoamide acetyltransferase)
MERALERREALKKSGTEVTITDLLVRSAALALRQFPQFNASYSDAGIVLHAGVHVGIAVGLDEGLITPVVRDADRKSLAQIAAEARDLVARAKTRRLEPNEYSGATFSISNLGMFEVENFIAIIAPPEAAILAVGAVREVPVVQNGKVVPGRRMKVTLSNDHRVVDGMQAAQFLRAFREQLENPQQLE